MFLEPGPLEISAWWALALAWPVLLVGEALVRRVRLFSEFNIPMPVIGGLTIALATLALHFIGTPVRFELATASQWRLWIVTADAELAAQPPPSQAVYYPLMVAFFASIGLSANPSVLRKSGVAIALVKRHGPAPEAFLVLPIAAGFLLDFTTAAVISLSIRLFS